MSIYDSANFLQSDEEEDEDQPNRRRCRHIFAIGRRCGSPCLRNEHFCYYHHTTRRPVSSPRERRSRLDVFDLPNPEDRDSARAAVTQIMHAIAHNNIDLKRAGMLLYSLQISICTLPPHPRPAPLKVANHIPLKDIVEDLIYEEPHGFIAPEDDYEEPEELKPRKSLGRQLLEEVERYEAQQAAEAEQARQAEQAAAAVQSPAVQTVAVQSATPPISAHPHRPAAIDLRAAAEEFPKPKSGRQPRLRARLQPCRNRNRRTAASAAEVRLQNPQPEIATESCIPANLSQTRTCTFNPAKAATHNRRPSVIPLIYLAATEGGARSAPASSTGHASHSRRADWHLNDHDPRDHRVPRRHQEALAPPT